MPDTNPLRLLASAGQSVWLDFLRRGLVLDGTLERLIADDLVAGVTSNPTIFQKAISGSADYDEAIGALAGGDVNSPLDLFYELALGDVALAADCFRAVHDQSGGADGFVSFELEPRLAHDAPGSIAAASRLFARLGRPNVMIKVPATEEAATVVAELTAAGVNVNITLLFSIERYEEVAEAFLVGLERRLAAGQPVSGISSVASFFVSRVDTVVDAHLPGGSPWRGRVAIANAKTAYQRFAERFAGPRWERLARAGARPQRLLWASTGTKNPAYSDVLYIEELVGPETVNTMPEATLAAFRDHGVVRPRAIAEGVEEATAVLAALPEHGIDLAAVAAGLLDDGLAAFEADLASLLATLEAKRSVCRT